MPWWLYAAFIALVTVLVLFDLCVLHRRAHAVSVRSAVAWTFFWIFLAMMFNVFVYFLYNGDVLAGLVDTQGSTGKDAAIAFLTAYVVEYSLSVDNIFVIAMIITSFRVPPQYQHRLLFWGVLTAAILRGVMVFGGVALIHQFEWIMYVFGALLIISGIKMLFDNHDEIDPEKSLLVRWTRKVYPVTTQFHGQQFFAYENGKRVATPMFLGLVLIESCDVMFAVDSIPAIFSITTDPFIVFTSNIFAVLGLRSLFFALSGLMGQLRYLTHALVVLLIYIGTKMILAQLGYKIDNVVSLGIIVSILTVGVVASLIAGRKEPPAHEVSQDGANSHEG